MNLKRILLALAAIVALTSGLLLAQDQSAAPKGKTAASKAAKSQSKEASAEKSGPKLDINTASQEDLEKLPGVGPVTAKKIIDGRPYRSKHELVTKKIVSQGEYDKIKEQIVAHQAKPAGAAAAKKK